MSDPLLECYSDDADKRTQIYRDMFNARRQTGGDFAYKRVIIRNFTNYEFTLHSAPLGSGNWTLGPAQKINPGRARGFLCEASRPWAGTSGVVRYDLGHFGERLIFEFNSPYKGEDTNRVWIENESRFRWVIIPSKDEKGVQNPYTISIVDVKAQTDELFKYIGAA